MDSVVLGPLRRVELPERDVEGLPRAVASDSGEALWVCAECLLLVSRACDGRKVKLA